MESTLSGAVCIRNGDELDFCWREAVKSLLPICDEVVICDGESNDGTQQAIREWMRKEPKINLCVYPWPKPKGDPDFWVDWLNYARQHARCAWHFQLDADEILHEKCYREIRKFVKAGQVRSARVTRWNFWRDNHHTIPDGQCCGKHVVRLAPANLWMASDGAHPKGAEVSNMAVDTGIEIFHYGFIRKPQAFFQKERRLQGYFFDTYDPRLQQAESFSGNWMQMPGVTGWENNLDPFNGEHPEHAKLWLLDRNYVA